MESSKVKTENQISLQKADLILGENYLVRISIKENAELEIEDMVQINEAKNKLVDNNPHLVLFIPPKYGTISKEARDFSASDRAIKNSIAKAIITRGFTSKLIGNVFIKIHKPAVPVRLFVEEEEALKWLLRMKNT